MKSNLDKMFFLVPLMIFFFNGTQKLISQDSLKVELIPLQTKIDVCNATKEITIVVQTNEIYTKDSLVGYDFAVEFDPDLISIDQALTQNTLTDQIIAAQGFTHFGLFERGLYTASAFIQQSSIYIKGKQPLIVFTGRYIGKCEGIASIKISDFDPAYNNFSKPKLVSLGQEKYINGEVADIQGRSLTVKFEYDSIKIDKKDSVSEFNVYFLYKQEAKITNATILFNLVSSEIIGIQSIDTLQDGLSIIEKVFSNDSTKLKISFNQNFQTSLPALKFKVKSFKDTNYQANLNASILETNKCNCVKQLIGDNINITKVRSDTIVDTLVSVKYTPTTSDIDIEIIDNKDILKIFSSHLMKEIALYNILGVELKRVKFDYPSLEVSLPQNLLQNGVYIVEVVTNAENKKNYIKFIK